MRYKFFVKTHLKNYSLSLFCSLAGNVLALSEQAFIHKVLTQDTHLGKDQIYVQIKQIELDASRENYAGWQSDLSATLGNTYYDISKETTSSGIYEKHRVKNRQSVRLGIEKRFLSNPGSLNISLSRATPDTDITRYKQYKYYGNHSIKTFDNVYQISYKYPLFKHDGNAESLKTYHRNILDLEREKFDFYDSKEGFLVDRLEDYLLWALYAESANVYQTYLQAIRNIKPNESDEKKLDIAIFRANKAILSNESNLQAKQKLLVVALNDTGLLLEKPQIDYNKRVVIRTKIDAYLRENVRALLKYQIDKKLKNIDLIYYLNQDLSTLDFKITAKQGQNQGNTLTTNYQNESVEYTANLSFSTPIGGNVNNQKNIEVAKLSLQKIDIDYNNKLKDIKSDVESLKTALLLNEKNLQGYGRSIKDIDNEANLAYRDYLNQSIHFKDLLDIYQEKRDIELEYINVVIDYHQNILEYNDALDSVLPIKKTAPKHYSTVTDLAKLRG